MRKSLKHLSKEEKKEYYRNFMREKYRKNKSTPVRECQTGLTDEEKKEKRRLKYLKDTEGKVKRHPPKMSDDEKKEHQLLKAIEYNKRSREKRKKNKEPRIILTDEEKKLRRQLKSKERYRLKQEALGKTIRPYRLTEEEKKERKVRKEKQVVINEKVIDKKPTKNYIINNDLTYEIILSKGKGHPTEKLKMFLYKMVFNINRRFNYPDKDMKYDIMMETYIYVMKMYDKFNEKKYSNSFAYITEIIKRSHTSYFNREINKGMKINPKTYPSNLKVGYYSSNEMYNL